jgi:transposase-like protein
LSKTKYDPTKNILVSGWARDGLSDIQIAKNLDIVPSTLYAWKLKHSEFAEAIKSSKEIVDYEVENALHKSAISGNVTAQIFWLKNRRPQQWRDRQDIEHGGKFDVNGLTLEQAEALLKQFMNGGKPDAPTNGV